MNDARTLWTALALPFVLGGCALAAVAPLTSAIFAFDVYKTVQLSTGGSVEVVIHDAKLTDEQRARLKTIRSIAIWPDKTGRGAVVMAESLQKSQRFVVVTPAQVAAAIKRLDLSDDLVQMTAEEAKFAFAKVCQETRADALVSGKPVGGRANANPWSFDRAHTGTDLLVTIYERAENRYIAELPVTVKVLVGTSMPSSEEVTTVANEELAKAILVLAQNPTLVATESRPASESSLSERAKSVSQSQAKQVPDFRPMTTREVQERLTVLGYKPGAPDGVMGKRTVDALKAFQRDSGIPITGQVDEQTTRRLQSK